MQIMVNKESVKPDPLLVWVDTLPIAAVMSQGHSIHLNRKAEELTGYRSNDIKSLSQWFKMVHRDENGEFFRFVNSCCQCGESFQAKDYIYRRSGIKQQIEFSGFRCEDSLVWYMKEVPDSNPVGFDAHLSELFYQLLFVGANEMIVMYPLVSDGIAGHFTQVNNKVCEVLGYTKKELAGMGFDDLIDPDDRQTMTDQWPGLESGHEMVVEKTLITRDGRKVPSEIRTQLFNWNGVSTGLSIIRDKTRIKQASDRLESVEWMLTQRPVKPQACPAYGDLTRLNTARLILDSVGKPLLEEVVNEYLSLLETSAAVYEKNGDYAVGIFSSNWCQCLDQASRLLCDTEDNAVALECGKWLCHESCWRKASLRAIESGQSVDVACDGGLRLYSEPIRAGDEIVGAINFGYGTPPGDKKTLEELSARYRIPVEELARLSKAYKKRPYYMIENAKARLHASALLIGEIVNRKRIEKTLHANQNMLRQVLDVLPQAIFWKDRESVYLGCNLAFARDIGFDHPDAVKGKTDYDMPWPESEANDYRKDDQEVIRSGAAKWHIIEPMERVDGSRCDVDTTKVPFRDTNGVIQGVLGICSDITEMKRAEEIIKASTEVVKSIPSGLFIYQYIEPDKLMFVDANPAALNYTQLALDECRGKEFNDIWPDARRRGLTEKFLQVMQTHKSYVDDTIIYADGRLAGAFKVIAFWMTGEKLGVAFEDITERKQAEQALQESERRYRQLFEEINSGFALHEVILNESGQPCDYRFLEINPAFERLTGLKASDLIGRTVLACMPDTEKYWIETYGRVAMTGESIHFENYSGALGRHYEVLAYCPDRGRFATLFHDITARKKIEEALCESEERFRTLFETMAPGVVYQDQHGKIIMANPAAERILGISQEDMKGKSSEDSHWQSIDIDGNVVPGDRHPAMIALQTGETVYNQVMGVYQPMRKDHIWLNITAVPQYRQGGARPYGVYATFDDITARIKAERALRESEEKFRSLFETMTEGVALHEIIRNEQGEAVDYRIIDVNPAYEKHTGLEAISVRGLLASELYRTGKPPYFDYFEQVARTGESYTFETWFEPMQRHFRIYVVSPFKDRFATVFEDITERIQQREELEQRNEEMARFTYTVSHDLKSPLVTIRAFLGYLKEDWGKGDLKKAESDMNYISNAAEKMSQLLEELLELSRIGRIVNDPVKLTLQELIQETLDLVAGRYVEGGIKVTITDTPVMLFGDRRRLRELYQNLLDNAAKFMGNQPEPHVEIGVECIEEEPVLFVKDNGIGVEPEYHSRLFRLFEKLDPAKEGTGIGLTLVQRIVRVHGGRIWVESKGSGTGTTFKFTLMKTHILSGQES